MNANQAREITEAAEIRLSVLNKIQLAYVRWKIKHCAKQKLDSTSVYCLNWKVAQILENEGYEILGPLPKFLSTSLFRDRTYDISWKAKK